jgi:hypothetical protein
MDVLLIDFFTKINLPCKKIADLDGKVVPREFFLNAELYKTSKDLIPDLKQVCSSSYLTALQASAETTQQWPFLNLIRQVLRSCKYKLTPKRLSDGYTLAGTKRYKRVFIIERMKI